MKNITLITLLVLTIGCNSNQEDNNIQNAVVLDFLQDVSSLENTENGNGIIQFQEIAITEASVVVNFSKENIEDMLNEAKDYKNCVIIVENHTIIKVVDFEDCKQSSSWGACMPYAEGYIKKGSYDFQEDYINNIIGLPDNQKRTAYLFN